MKKAAAALLVLILMFALFACGEKQGAENTPQEEDRLTIGFSMGSLMEDRWVRDREILLSKARQEGIDVIVTNANGDTDTQYKQVKEMMEQGIDVLLIVPNNSAACGPCVEVARQHNVPVISYDRLVYGADVDAYVTFDNYQVGAKMARELKSKVPNGGYVFVNGDPGDSNCEEIRRGVFDVLNSSIVAGDINMLGETSIPGWNREGAYEYMVETIRRYGDQIDAVVVGNDSLAWGVIDALYEAQITDVQVSGQDADLVACRRVVQGQQAVTIYKPIEELVAGALELCKEVTGGAQLSATKTISDGTYEVPYKAIEVIAVTKDNMEDTVIKGGFHTREEVYRSVEDEYTATTELPASGGTE